MARIRTRWIVLALSLFLPLNAWGQTVTPVGSPERFDVATWNIEWFGSTTSGPSDVQRQFNNVRSIIEGAEIDLWGVQEIANPALFSALIDSLGDDYRGALATYSQTQKIGFIYRRDVVSPQSIAHILESFNYAFAFRPPLELHGTITLPDTSLAMTFITVHLKAFPDAESYERRKESSTRLKNHIEFLRANQSVIVLGDFNDRLTTSTRAGYPSPFENFVDDPERYRFVTFEAEERGEHSYIGSQRSMIDHILITQPLFGYYVEDSAQPWSDLTRTFLGFATNTSDHLPVYASFDFRTTSSADGPLELPVATSIESIYPNPSMGPISVELTMERGSHVRIDVMDMAGREVAILHDGFVSAGRQAITSAIEGVAAGMYFVRLRTDDGVSVRPITVVR